MNDLNGYVPVHAVIASDASKTFKGKFVKLVGLIDNSTLATVSSNQIQQNGSAVGTATAVALNKGCVIEGIVINEFKVGAASAVLAYSITSNITVS